MKADKSTYDFIRSPRIEGEKLEAYRDTKKIWTIGPGVIFYPDGSKVKKGDVITQERSEELFYLRAKEFETDVNNCLDRELTRRQWNVLFSVAWNYGTGWYQRKRLIVAQFNKDPGDLVEIERILKLMDNRNRRMHELSYLKNEW